MIPLVVYDGTTQNAHLYAQTLRGSCITAVQPNRDSEEYKAAEAQMKKSEAALTAANMGTCHKVIDVATKEYIQAESRFASFSLTPLRPVLVQDNAPTHSDGKLRANLGVALHDQLRIVPWPPRSPDLNPIENIWSWLDKKTCQHTIRNKQDIMLVVKKIIDEHEEDLRKVINNCVLSLWDRALLVLKAKGASERLVFEYQSPIRVEATFHRF
eukprot:GILJ01024576.1.p1 GENE.GILJ01024576.1~~GILJ01024576.1.p1  ORF type:complete len:213 (-),score=22.39 GILJ01024576.1:121-759(-)